MKKFISAFVAMCLIVASSAVSAKSDIKFKDLSSKHWAYDYVSTMVEYGAVNGYNDNTFKPSNNVSRAEWAKLLVKTADIPIYNDYKSVIDASAEDVNNDDWYAPYLVTMLPYYDFDEYWTAGKTVTYKPNTPATRLEIVKSIIVERGYDAYTPDYSLVIDFDDYADIDDTDVKYAAIAVEKGIIKGFDDNTLRPNDSVTRAEACTILYRSYMEDEAKPEMPYVFSTLASGNIGDPYMATLDDKGNLFFIDIKDNCVYKVTLDDRKKVKYIDFSNFLYETSEGGVVKKYSSYQATQLFYNKVTRQLILNGIFTGLSQPAMLPVSDGKFTHMYDITDAENYDTYYIQGEQNDSKLGCKVYIQSALDKEAILAEQINRTALIKINVNTGDIQKIPDARGFNERAVVCIVNQNNIYKIKRDRSWKAISTYGDQIWLEKYNYTDGRFDFITEALHVYAVGIKGSNYYFLGMGKDNNFYKMDMKTLIIEKLDINTSTESTIYTDAIGVEDMSSYFYVVNDETFIFHDRDNGVFRILESTENKMRAENKVKPYRVNEIFYESYKR